MQRNTEKCTHCGHRLIRLNEKTALINRTDEKTFHLTLFSGPYRRCVTSGDLHGEQLVCTFSYIHDQPGPNHEHVAVTVHRANPGTDAALSQVEEVADKIAELLSKGKKLERVYSFNQSQLEPGLSK